MRQLQLQLTELAPSDQNYATKFVDDLLLGAERLGASDVHLLPGSNYLEVKLRVDGVLNSAGTFPLGTATSVVTRLKVLAGLLTYRTDAPQEGRLQRDQDSREMRISTLPTLHGERIAIRIFSSETSLTMLADLQLGAEITESLARELKETAGMIIVAGPAGSGKTTTLYACLRQIAHDNPARSLVSLEDPIEMELPGVAQSEVNSSAGYDLLAGLRAVVRQDPEVIMVGEIRDAETAAVAMQASLTGQLVLTSFHAPSAAAALGRLADMQIPPFVIRSGVRAVLAQRLVRRLCECAQPTQQTSDFLGWNVTAAKRASGCERCHGAGYRGRLVIAEWLSLSSAAVTNAILEKRTVQEIAQAAISGGMTTLSDRGTFLVQNGQTSPAELRRVLGWNTAP